MFQKAQSELFIIEKFSSLNLGLNRVNYFLRQPNNQEKQPAKPQLLQEAFHPRLNVAWTKLRNMNENVQDWGEFVNRYTSCSSRNSSPDRDTVFGDVKRTPSPGLPLFSLSDKHFCRRDNIDQCLAYLNQVSVRDNPARSSVAVILSRLIDWRLILGCDVFTDCLFCAVAICFTTGYDEMSCVFIPHRRPFMLNSNNCNLSDLTGSMLFMNA